MGRYCVCCVRATKLYPAHYDPARKRTVPSIPQEICCSCCLKPYKRTRPAGPIVNLTVQEGGAEVCSRSLVKALLALHAALAVSSESLGASIGRVPAGDAPAMLQV